MYKPFILKAHTGTNCVCDFWNMSKLNYENSSNSALVQLSVMAQIEFVTFSSIS